MAYFTYRCYEVPGMIYGENGINFSDQNPVSES